MDSFTYKLLGLLGFVFVLLISQTEGSLPYSHYLPADDKITRTSEEDDNTEDATGSQRIRAEDLRKLILKKLRFRDLEDVEKPTFDEYLSQMSNSHNQGKRSQDRDIVDKVAALLSGFKVRQVEPNVRMPSLRFGRK